MHLDLPKRKPQPMTQLATLAETVETVRTQSAPISEAQRKALGEVVRVLSDDPTIGVSDVAHLLGVSSPTTIHNWLEQGYFPGVTRTPGGHRKFRMSDVLAMKARMERIDAQNAAGNLEIPYVEDDDE